MNIQSKSGISNAGSRIINCLQAFLSAHEIRGVINQYIMDNRSRNIGYEGIVRFHLGMLLVGVFGRTAVLAEAAARPGRGTKFHDLLIKEDTNVVAIEIKAYKSIKGYEDRYKKDFSAINEFVLNGRGVENESHNEAFFVHYNHDCKCCQTKAIVESRMLKGLFDYSMSYVITEKNIKRIGEKGCDMIAPSFFLTFHRSEKE